MTGCDFTAPRAVSACGCSTSFVVTATVIDDSVGQRRARVCHRHLEVAVLALSDVSITPVDVEVLAHARRAAAGVDVDCFPSIDEVGVRTG